MEIITRAEAKELGLKRYFTGKACKWGHIAVRSTSCGKCYDCAKAYKIKNREHISMQTKEYKNRPEVKARSESEEFKKQKNARNKEWRDKSKAQIKEYYSEYSITNREKIKEYKKQYRQDNKERLKIYKENYRKTEVGSLSHINSRHKRRSIMKSGDVTIKQLLDLRNKYTKCYWCDDSLVNKKSHIDHYIPLSKGGNHTISNLVVTCAKCNLTKHSKMPEEFAHSIGKLL